MPARTIRPTASELVEAVKVCCTKGSDLCKNNRPTPNCSHLLVTTYRITTCQLSGLSQLEGKVIEIIMVDYNAQPSHYHFDA